jgi:hypothetical protein
MKKRRKRRIKRKKKKNVEFKRFKGRVHVCIRPPQCNRYNR